MALFTGEVTQRYARASMPKPVSGDGPWGQGITYWLNRRGWRQADLQRAINEPANEPPSDNPISKNTISDATRGLDVNTATLRRIAKALDAPLDEVLVSPDRKDAREARKQLVLEITEKVVRDLEAAHAPPPTAPPAIVINSIEQEAVRAIPHIPKPQRKRKRKKKS